MKVMAEIGNPNSVTDAGVGVLCARSAVIGAFLNVKINTNASLLNEKKCHAILESKIKTLVFSNLLFLKEFQDHWHCSKFFHFYPKSSILNFCSRV